MTKTVSPNCEHSLTYRSSFIVANETLFSIMNFSTRRNSNHIFGSRKQARCVSTGLFQCSTINTGESIQV